VKLGILHLSDIHLRKKTDIAIGLTGSIAKACYQIGHQSDDFIIVVTGDIAFGGQEEEYKLAKGLLVSLKDLLQAELGKVVNIFLAPGNHDCSLLPEDEIRTLTIDRVIEDAGKDIKDSWINKCTEAQKEYFLFESSIRGVDPIFSDALWHEFEVTVGGGVVRISALNAAWMSRLHEVQGQLVFPIEKYIEQLEAPSSLRLALIHHPLNWYCQSSYHPLRKALRTHCGAILSGHEHSVGSEVIQDSNGHSVLMLESPALQPHEGHLKPEFTCLLFDTEENTVIERRYEATTHLPVQVGCESTHAINLSGNNCRTNKIHPDFAKYLMDPGGNFSHPEKGSISSEMVFIYPQLEEATPEVEKNIIYADELINDWRSKRRILILGDDESGKTFLMYKAFLDVHSQGGLPLYLKAADIGSITGRELDKVIEESALAQYAEKEEFLYAERNNKVVVFDDLDRVAKSVKLQENLIKLLEERFGTVIATANSRFKLGELIGGGSAETLSLYPAYKIKPFGHVMRNRLIKKWCLLGEIESLEELDSKVFSIEKLINGILGRNIVPAKPIYLLIFLQSHEQQQQGELQNSSFSYYYEYLVIKSLRDAGYRNDHLDEMFSYLSHLAWFFKESERKELHVSELRRFNSKFSEEITSVDFDSRLAVLSRAKILSKSGEYFRFTYSYIYYLYVGKYLSDNLHYPEFQDLVARYCSDLFLRENANTVMFLTHHTSNPLVVDYIADTLNQCFGGHAPMSFNGDMVAVNALVESTANLVIKDLDVQENQEKQKQLADNLESKRNDREESEQEWQEANSESEKFDVATVSSKINLTIKTSEILGSIVKNYYGSISKIRKKQYLSNIFDGSLRSLGALFSEIIEQPEGLVLEVEKALRERRPDIPEAEVRDQSKKFIFQFIGMICTSFVARVGQLVSSEKIREEISAVVRESGSNAYRLIGVASCLTQPGNIPFDELEKLARDLKDNPFAFTILQSLVYYHLHMFHTGDREKQKLASIAQISIHQSRVIDHASKKSKMSDA